MKVYRAKQSGSALLIAMIMLFMISIMGITVMQSSSLEHRMTTNAIETKAVFQSAESVTEAALNSNANIAAAHKVGLNGFVTESLNLNTNTEIMGVAQLEFLGKSIPPGFSGGGTLEGWRFRATGVVSRNGESGAGVAQGAFRIVPAN